MRASSTRWRLAGLAICLAVCASAFKLPKPIKSSLNAPEFVAFSQPMDESLAEKHALDRLTFGARQEDVAVLRSEGLHRWLEEQLRPERIPENPALTGKLAPLESLNLSIRDTYRQYPSQRMIANFARGRGKLPEDPELSALVTRLSDRYLRRKAAGQAAANADENDLSDLDVKVKLTDIISPEQATALESGTPDGKRAVLASIPVERGLDLGWALSREQRNQLIPLAPEPLRRRLMMVNAPQNVVASDLAEAKLLRAVYSNRQLEEVMDDFWFNHFNVFANKGGDRYLLPTYEREAIRPHVFGKFKDLLIATAKSPAMLFYLDNWESVSPEAADRLNQKRQQRRASGSNPPFPRPVFGRPGVYLPPWRPPAPPPVVGNGNTAGASAAAAAKAKGRRRGLNENYGRELLELHTLGVNGGYTQADVVAVARCFTGWTINAREGGDFKYDDRVHDKGEKIVLGHKIAAGGDMSDGLKVIEILAHHPSTAHFLAYKLAVRFVADQPPPSLVDRMANAYMDSDGEIRTVLETMVKSPEFWSQGAYTAKFKTPLEMVASSLRVTNADVQSAFTAVNELGKLGQPLYRKVEPTGYSAVNAEWINSGALLERLNFALALTGNRVRGITVPPCSSFDPQQILAEAPTPETQSALQKATTLGQGSTTGMQVAVVLGSPQFQRR